MQCSGMRFCARIAHLRPMDLRRLRAGHFNIDATRFAADRFCPKMKIHWSDWQFLILFLLLLFFSSDLCSQSSVLLHGRV